MFVAAELAHGDHALRRAMESNGLLPELLGCKGRLDLAAAAEKATDSRAQVIALGVVLAALEANITREAWRTPQPAHKRYLRFLASIGYQLSDVEQLVIDPKKKPRKANSGPTSTATAATTAADVKAEPQATADATSPADAEAPTDGGVAA